MLYTTEENPSLQIIKGGVEQLKTQKKEKENETLTSHKSATSGITSQTEVCAHSCQLTQLTVSSLQQGIDTYSSF